MLGMTSMTIDHASIPADTLAARLLLVRHEMHWTQREAAAATGVPFGVWQGMEMGRETRGLDRHITAIAEHSGYDRDWLMWGGTLSTPAPNAPGGRVTRQYQALALASVA